MQAEITRRLNDGIYIRVTPVVSGVLNPREPEEVSDWVHVSISSLVGQPLYTGTMRLWEALAEIPYQIDRAREFDRDYDQATNVTRDNGDN